MDEYERLVRLSVRLKDQMAKMTGLLVHDPLREAKNKVEIQISELLLAEAATAPAETPPSSLATESMEAPSSTYDISSRTFFLVREGLTGSRRTMAMVTLVERNSILSLGELRGFLQDGNWSLHPLTTWELPSQSGSTPSVSQEEPGAGPSAGGSVTLDFDNECSCAGGWPLPHGERDHANAPHADQDADV